MLLFATDSVSEYLAAEGMNVAGPGDRPEAVFVAHPGTLDFACLERGARAIMAGARLLTASYVAAYAGANGPILSRGAMTTAALSKASSTRPVIVGKPSRAAIRTIENKLGARGSEVVVIGDDLTMDVAMGKMDGTRTILVASGITGRPDPDSIPERRRPDAIVDGVAEVLGWI